MPQFIRLSPALIEFQAQQPLIYSCTRKLVLAGVG